PLAQPTPPAPACRALSRRAMAAANANPWTLMRRLISTLSPEALRRHRLGAGVYHVGAEACQAIRRDGPFPRTEDERGAGSGIRPRVVTGCRAGSGLRPHER